MKKTFLGLGCLVLTGITAILVSMKIVQAQRNSWTVKDANGKEVIVYQESHALVIWAKDYKNWSKLDNVQNEAKEVVTALEKQGFQVSVIENPDRHQLNNGIKSFIDDYGYLPNNRLVIFFAGHGHTRQQTKGYLVPVDAPDPIVDERGFLKAALSMEQINSWASQMEAKHVLFVFDSCFSGTIFQQRSNGDDARDAYIRDRMNKPVRQFLTAGDANEKVPAKSVFTPLFLRALEGDADYTQDGYVTGSELGLYLTQNLTDYTRGNQHPQFGTIWDPNLNRGDIVFRSSMAVASSSPSTVKPIPAETSTTSSQSATSPVAKITPTPQPSSSPQLTAKAFYDSGVDKYKAGDYRGAIIDYFESIRLEYPELHLPYYNRGLAKKKLGDDYGAIADFNQAIKLNPDYAEAYYSRGVSKNNLHDYQGAITDYNQAIKLNPDYASTYYNRGNSKNNLQDYQGAIADYNQAIKLNPDYAEAYYSRGNSKDNLRDYQGAITDFSQAIKLNPDSDYFYYNRGSLYKKINDNENAIKDFRQAAELYQQKYNQHKDDWDRYMYQDSLDRLKELGVSN